MSKPLVLLVLSFSLLSAGCGITNPVVGAGAGGLAGGAIGASTGTAIGAGIANGDIAASALLGTAIGVPVGAAAGALIVANSSASEIARRDDIIEENAGVIANTQANIESERAVVEADSFAIDVGDSPIDRHYHGARLGSGR